MCGVTLVWSGAFNALEFDLRRFCRAFSLRGSSAPYTSSDGWWRGFNRQRSGQ